MEWYEVLISVLSGLAVTIPLVIKLVEYVKKAIQEKNWGALLTLLMNLMAEAEEKFDNGADRKTYVMSAIEASAKTINYIIDMEEVSALIDNLVAMSKRVNPPKQEVTE